MRAEDKEALTSREAYAVASQMATTIKEQHELIRRAAELLLEVQGVPPDWKAKRNQWLDDSGIGQFSKESLKAAMKDEDD